MLFFHKYCISQKSLNTRKTTVLSGWFVFNILFFFQTNTFQMILATDEVFSYVIFNYADMQWTSHTEAGGDTSGGEGGVPAYVSLSRKFKLERTF